MSYTTLLHLVSLRLSHPSFIEPFESQEKDSADYLHSPLCFQQSTPTSELSTGKRRFLQGRNSLLQQTKMSTKETSNQGTPQLNPGEELNLSLRGEPSRASRESEVQSRLASGKVFSCNFCMRKFYSSQALGGHQNAHKRERGAVRHYQLHKKMAMMALPMPIRTSLFRSLGVQAHSLVHKAGRDENTTVVRFSEANTRFGISRPHGTLEVAADLLWPGSFRQEPQQPEQKSSNPTMLDLNLKL
ncbi:zinc finger protein 1-like [Salvia divinorum]|uniref:Zinc finger protein 1-like n=1 Tax=Salvia divinorum TaxID=28513 RepID=A0ABD1I9L8_SALDI